MGKFGLFARLWTAEIEREAVFILPKYSVGVCSAWRVKLALRGPFVAEMRGITATPFACRALTRGKRSPKLNIFVNNFQKSVDFLVPLL